MVSKHLLATTARQHSPDARANYNVIVRVIFRETWGHRIVIGYFNIAPAIKVAVTVIAINSHFVVAQPGMKKSTVAYREVDGHRILADVYRPDDKEVRPVILWIHGGALIMGQRDPGRLGREAIDIIDRVVPLRPVPQLMNLRVKAAILAGDYDMALASMHAILTHLGAVKQKLADSDVQPQSEHQWHAGDVRAFVEVMDSLAGSLSPDDSLRRLRLLQVRIAFDRQLGSISPLPSRRPHSDF